MNGTDSNENEIVPTRSWWTLVALLIVGFTLWMYGQVKVATAVIWEDTPGYLGHALYIAEHGGLWGFLREAYGGVFPIIERHPLYLLMIAPFAARTPEFFWDAKLVNLATGVAILVSLLWMVERRYGRGPALIAGVVYSLSNSLVTASSHVDNEPVYVLCALWAWWFLTAVPRVATGEPALDAEPDVARNRLKTSDMPSSWTSWAIGGALVGLAYLAKSPAILIAVSVIVAATWHAGLRFLGDRRFAAFVVALVIVSSPLVVRNIIGFGTPLYEGINSHVMWLEDGSEFGDERSVLYEDQYGALTIERNGLPTASDYFASHSITDVPRRLATGLYRELRMVVPDAIRSLLVPIGGRKISFLVLGLALVGWWLRRRSWDAALVFFWSGAFIAFFSWDIYPEMRYLAPLVPVWIVFAAHAIWTLGVRVVSARTLWQLESVGVLAAIGAGIGLSVTNGSLAAPPGVMHATPAHFRFIDWLTATIEPGDRIVVGPTREFWGLLWTVDRPLTMLLSPSATTLDGFQRYLYERKVRYLLMHSEYLTRANPEIAAELERYIGVTPERAFFEKESLPRWVPVYRDEGSPPRFIVYEAAGTAPHNGSIAPRAAAVQPLAEAP